MSPSLARIGINALFLEPGMGGLETYVREMVPRLAEQTPNSAVTIIANPNGGQSLADASWPANVSLHVPRVIGTSGLRALSETTVLGVLASMRFEALFNVALTGPLATRAANVVKIADVTWMADFESDAGQSATYRLWRLVVPHVARRADRVVALTAFGAAEVAAALDVPMERIDIVGNGLGTTPAGATTDSTTTRARFGLGDAPVILNLGVKKPHKNLMRLIEAMGIVRMSVPDAVLVLPGAATPYEEDLRRRAEELGLTAAVRFPGYVTDDDVEALYSVADCFAFPSLSEGFGLPLLEAMNRGVPVVTSTASCLPEVAGDAAVLVDAYSEHAIADGVVRVLTDAELRDQLITAGRRRCQHFTWERCATGILDSLERAAAQRDSSP